MSHTKPKTLPTITPKTTGVLTIQLSELDTGDPVEDAVVTADVFHPMGRRLATDQAAVHVVSGAYELIIQPSWSTNTDGSAVEGVFVAEVLVVREDVQSSERIQYLVRYDG